MNCGLVLKHTDPDVSDMKAAENAIPKPSRNSIEAATTKIV
jgi:hypothetical protein